MNVTLRDILVSRLAVAAAPVLYRMLTARIPLLVSYFATPSAPWIPSSATVEPSACDVTRRKPPFNFVGMKSVLTSYCVLPGIQFRTLNHRIENAEMTASMSMSMFHRYEVSSQARIVLIFSRWTTLSLTGNRGSGPIGRSNVSIQVCVLRA